MNPDPDLPASLDAVHARVRAAFQARDLAAYMAFVAPDLEYRGPGERHLTRDGMAAAVADQFRRLVAFDSSLDRATLEVAGDDAIEAGTQTASIALRWFGVLAIRWTVRRRGTYTWRRAANGWQLRAVALQEERVQRDGIGFAHRVRLGARD